MNIIRGLMLTLPRHTMRGRRHGTPECSPRSTTEFTRKRDMPDIARWLLRMRTAVSPRRTANARAFKSIIIRRYLFCPRLFSRLIARYRCRDERSYFSARLPRYAPATRRRNAATSMPMPLPRRMLMMVMRGKPLIFRFVPAEIVMPPYRELYASAQARLASFE